MSIVASFIGNIYFAKRFLFSVSNSSTAMPIALANQSSIPFEGATNHFRKKNVRAVRHF
jgi:hypothetical protein